MKKFLFVIASFCLLGLPIESVEAENTLVDTSVIVAQEQDRESFNLAPLLKTVANLIGSDRLYVESIMQIIGENPGVRVRFDAQIKTTVESPNRFNSQITFISSDSAPGKQYQIVSNGSRVLIHDVSNKQYSIVSYEEFVEGKDDFLIGMLGYLYLSSRKDDSVNLAAQLIENLSEEEIQAILEQEFDLDADNIETRIETIDGESYQAYKIKDKKSTYVFDVLLDLQTQKIHSFALSGVESGINFVFQEEYIQQTKPENVSELTFRFLPPIGSTEATETVKISPY